MPETGTKKMGSNMSLKERKKTGSSSRIVWSLMRSNVFLILKPAPEARNHEQLSLS